MVDYFLLFCMMVLVTTMIIHTYVAHLCYRAKKEEGDSKNYFGTDGNKHNKIMRKGFKSGIGRFPPYRSKTGHKAKSGKSSDFFRFAERVNFLGKIFLLLVFLGFNAVFWIIAVFEYATPAEEYVPTTL